MKIYKLKCCTAFALAGVVIVPGQIVDVDEPTAKDLLRRGKAVNAPVELVSVAEANTTVRGRLAPSYFADMNKADTLKVAKEMGLDVPAGATKAQIVEMICAEEVEADAADVTPAEA